MSSFVTKYYAFYNCISVYLMHNVHSKICTCDSMTLWVIIQIQKDMRKVLAMLRISDSRPKKGGVDLRIEGGGKL